MSEELTKYTTDLVSAAESQAATSEDFIRELKESFDSKIDYEQNKIEFEKRKRDYNSQLSLSYRLRAAKLLSHIWHKCGRRKYGHDFTESVMVGSYNIQICRICKRAKDIYGKNESLKESVANKYNQDQITELGGRLFAKDKEAGILLSYEEQGGK